MKTLIIIFFTILLTIPCFSQQDLPLAFPNEIYYRGEIAYVNNTPFTGKLIDENNKTLGEFKYGYKNGLFTEYFTNGKIKFQGVYVLGKKDGTHTNWNEDDNKISENNFSNGLRNGLSLEWYPNNTKKFEGSYLAGNKEGTFVEYYENGNQKSKIEYSKDFLNGENKNFYPNGNAKNSTIYISGLKNGKYSEWHENGKLRKEMVYYGNKISDDKIIEYDQSGQKLIELGCKSGQVYSEYYYKDSIQIVYSDYIAGNKEAKGKLLNGRKDGYWTEWYINGQKSFDGNYIYGQREGKGIEYSQDGSIMWDGFYKNGEKNGKGLIVENNTTLTGEWNMGKKSGQFVEIYVNKSRAEGNYINDIKEGLWTEWFPNGNKMLEIQYTNGNIVNSNYIAWFENGQKKEEKTYVNSQLNGNHTNWFNNGNVASTLIYVNGKIKDGQYFVFESSGNIDKEWNYINGKIISEYAYGGRLKNGKFVEYYTDGSKKIEGRYESGKRKIGQRYGANKRANSFFKGIGSLAIVAGIIYAATVLSPEVATP